VNNTTVNNIIQEIEQKMDKGQLQLTELTPGWRCLSAGGDRKNAADDPTSANHATASQLSRGYIKVMM